jgi:hypothetical protein
VVAESIDQVRANEHSPGAVRAASEPLKRPAMVLIWGAISGATATSIGVHAPGLGMVTRVRECSFVAHAESSVMSAHASAKRRVTMTAMKLYINGDCISCRLISPAAAG